MRPVVIVYRQLRYTSAQIQAVQRAEALRHMGVNATCIPIKDFEKRKITNSFIIFVKYLPTESHKKIEMMKLYRSRGNTIVWDVVDAGLSFIKKTRIRKLVDGCLFANSSYPDNISHYTAYCPWDTRLLGYESDNNEKFKIGYIGKRSKSSCLDLIDESSIINTKKEHLTKKDKLFMQTLNCHFSVVRRDPIIDTNTKISVAGALNSNIICLRTKTSEDLLGKDYPFLLESDSHDEVKSMIEYCRDSFNSSVWYMGLERTKSVKDRTNHVACAKDLISTLRNIEQNSCK